MSVRRHDVEVRGLLPWLDARRLLGPGRWEHGEGDVVRAQLSITEAADLAARLRGLGLGGVPVELRCDPPLPRAAVRAARTQEARRRRATTPGFSRGGARAQDEGRFSLTPEALALRLGELAAGREVVDACAGAGGNTLGFARAGCRVTALEQSEQRLEELRHNLSVYGVGARVRVCPGDMREVLKELKGDLLFADPPWGEQYDRVRCPRAALPLLEPVLAARPRFSEVWLKLPPSFAVDEIQPREVSAWFGDAEGDRRRVKFLLAKL